MEQNNIVELIKILINKGVDFTDVYELNGLYCILIEWGDWKHSHSYCENVMRELGYTFEGETIVEENGSDCYSSVHYYKL